MKRVLPWLLFVAFAAVAIAVWANWPTLHAGWFDRVVKLRPGVDRVAAQGQFGDSFGAVNALFSAMAMTAVAFTILLQIQQSKQQRADFEATLAAQRAEEHRQNCLVLWQNWSSEDMFGVRERVAAHLEGLPIDTTPQTSSRYLGSLRQRDPKAYFDVERLFHFFSDLLRFDEAGVIDSALARSLFGSTIRYWAGRFSHMSYLSASDDEDAYRLHLEGWRETTVKKLKAWCSPAEAL
jgi:hypothetical protein